MVKMGINKALEEGKNLLVTLDTGIVCLDWKITDSYIFLLDEIGLHIQHEYEDNEIHVEVSKDNIVYDKTEEMYQFDVEGAGMLCITIL